MSPHLQHPDFKTASYFCPVRGERGSEGAGPHPHQGLQAMEQERHPPPEAWPMVWQHPRVRRRPEAEGGGVGPRTTDGPKPPGVDR